MTENSVTSAKDNTIDDKLAKQLIRQLKLINFWISFYGVIMIIILGFLLYMIIQMVMFVRTTNERIDQMRNDAASSLNVQKQTCEGGNAVTEWLKKNTEICK